MKKLLSIILALCLVLSAVAVSGISVSAATADESVGAVITCGDYQYEIINNAARITGYTGETGENVVLNIPKTLDGNIVKYIKNNAFKSKIFETVRIPDTVTYIGTYAFYNVWFVNLGKNVETIDTLAFRHKFHCLYLPKSIKTIESDSLKVVDEIYYEGSFEDFANIDIVDQDSILYEIQHSTYTGKVKIYYNCSSAPAIGHSKIFSDDFKLQLSSKSIDVEVGDIPLEAGTYELKVQKADGFYTMNGNNVCGYNKTVNDNTAGGLTLNPKYKLPVKLVASGGVYRFTLNNKTNVLMIKRVDELPEVYAVGDIHTIFKPVSGTNYYVAACQSFPESFENLNFKISKNGKILGAQKNTAITLFDPKLTLSEAYSKNLYLVSGITGTGPDWVYSFIFNYETNEFSGHYDTLVPSNDLHIESAIKLKITLDDNNGQSNIAAATANVEAGAYHFIVVDHGVTYGGNYIYRDNGYHTLNKKYRSAFLLVASGGTYSFTFNKTTGVLKVKKIS